DTLALRRAFRSRFRPAVRFLVQPRPLFRRNPLPGPPTLTLALGFAHATTRVSPVTHALVRRKLLQHLGFTALLTPLAQRLLLALVKCGHGVSLWRFPTHRTPVHLRAREALGCSHR